MFIGGLPSTPGAYHAAHLHWRWGKYLQERHRYVKSVLPLNKSGDSQFVSKTGVGGPLLDPNIPYQSIRFALVLLTTYEWRKIIHLVICAYISMRM